MNKIIDDAHYHIWSDALHLRELARQTPDRWDRATYIRAAVTMAWTAFETTLSELLNAKRLSGNFQQNLDAAVRDFGLPQLDWGQGIWQSVAILNKCRVDYVHRTAAGAELLPEGAVADDALNTIRDALDDIFSKAGKMAPAWIADDSDPGWKGSGKSGAKAYGSAIHGGVDPEAADTLRLALVDKNGEHVCGYYPATANPKELAADLLPRLREPVSVIRVYKGKELVCERKTPMRGAPD